VPLERLGDRVLPRLLGVLRAAAVLLAALGGLRGQARAVELVLGVLEPPREPLRVLEVVALPVPRDGLGLRGLQAAVARRDAAPRAQRLGVLVRALGLGLARDELQPRERLGLGGQRDVALGARERVALLSENRRESSQRE